jgi:hypothetical protein
VKKCSIILHLKKSSYFGNRPKYHGDIFSFGVFKIAGSNNEGLHQHYIISVCLTNGQTFQLILNVPMNDVEQRFVALTPLLSKCNYRESLTLQMIQMRNCRQLKRCSASFIDICTYICTYIHMYIHTYNSANDSDEKLSAIKTMLGVVHRQGVHMYLHT